MKFKNQAVVLKIIRTNREMTQKQMAKSMGFNVAQIVSNAERAICQIPLNRLRKMDLSKSEKSMLVSARVKDVIEEFGRVVGL